MTLRRYFKKAQELKSLSNVTAEEVALEVESVGYHDQDVIKDERFIPQIDFSNPANFARYGSAEEYYEQSIKRIYNTYPYDGSLKEKLEWENESSYIDLYIFDNRYPRTNGYAIFCADANQAGSDPTSTNGYGLPTTKEYIYFKGGPNTNPDGMSPYSVQFTGSNYYHTASNRESNLKFDLANKGVSIEFWLKKDGWAVDSTEKEVIFDLWNSGSGDTYGRLRLELSGASALGVDPFLLTALSGGSSHEPTSPIGFIRSSIASSTVTTASVADGNWHHYAVTLKSASAGVTTRFYIDGALDKESILWTTGSLNGAAASGINEVTGAMQAYIGALVASPADSSAAAGAGKLSGSLDEFRYWKTQRTSKDIGKYWFTQVGGGTNSDPEPGITAINLVNTNLGVYYKFNEGITGITSTDNTVLDYSGRVTNGTWTGYTSNSRNLGSAIVSASAATKEFKDPIIYPTHPSVTSLESELAGSGSWHDTNNNASLYGAMPGWVSEEDELGSKDLKYLTQIMGSYLDTLHLQIEALSKLKDKTYPSGSNKPLVFANRLLESNGLIAPEMFLDADILEKLADRSEKRLYEKTLTDIKNTIYQNIYNNLSFIYKSKGTEKSFRNLIRCYGIDDELIKFNLYANNIEYELQDNVTSHVLAKRFVDFNTSASIGATVYQTGSAIAGSTYLTGGFAFTTEANVTFPIKAKRSDTNFISNEFLTSSIFGLHKTLPYYGDPNSTTWAPHGVAGATDEVNFQVYALRDEIDSTSVRFRLTGTTGGFVPELTSDLYEDVYDNTNWTLAVRIKPEKYPYAGLINYDPTTGSAGFGNYIVELHGINVQDGALLNEFNISGSYTAAHGTVPAFVTGNRRLYAGAHRTNFTGSIREYSDVKVGSVRHWLNYLEDATLLAHAKDIENFGTLHATRYPYPFLLSDMSGATRLNGLYASFGELTSLDTLVLNWDFNQITSSNASGEFTVRDYSSGSSALPPWTPGIASGSWLGTILTGSNSGQGYGFASNDTKAIDKDYITAVRQNLPENLSSQDMIEVYDSAERDMFFKNIRPTNFSYAFEKSMYQIISEEMLRYFATIRDLHNLIGEPVNRYRMNYKMMGKARQAFFAKVQNETIDFDKFYEYYKWFDSSLSIILMQLVPASADVAENIRMMIESHVLERNKYQTKFPTADFKDPLGGPGSGLMETTLASTLPPHPQQGGGSSGDILASGAPTMRQIGSSGDRLFGGWRFNHAPLPLSPPPESKNKDWWKGNAEKTEWTYGGATEFNKSRQALFNKIEQKACKSDRFYNYVKGKCLEVVPRNQAPAYRFSMTIEPVYRCYDNYHQNKRSGIVFGTTRPAGALRAPNLPINVALGLAEDREQLMDIQDEVYPHFRQRLGFKLDSVINKPGDDDYLTADGNITAPFSLYSSSVTTEHNALVTDKYAPGVEITNLHNDGYGPVAEIPLQGLFTETWVGGREYRHVDINREDSLKAGPNNLDSPDDRPEGFKLLLGRPSIGAHSHPAGALGIVDPQYPDPDSPSVSPPYLFDRPKANMARDLITKRPVNIRNILSTTSSTRLGNYSKNYQVIQTAGRSINDPFFQDQSFNFALNPETLATRGRTPMARPAGGIGSALFGGSTGFLQMDTDSGATWEALIGGAGAAAKAYSYSLWVNPSAMDDTYPRLISFGTADRSLMINHSALGAHSKLKAANNTGATSRVQSTTALAADTWYHIVVTYAGGSHSAGDFKIYLNGADDSTAENTAAPDTITGENSTIGCYAANNSNYAGYMCDVVVWDRKLSASEVSKLYNGGTRIDPVSVARSGILSYWPLAEPNIILDSIGGRNLSPGTAGTVASRPNTPPVNATVNPGGQLRYELPGRTGSTSNKTVIVNRFSSPGSYEVLSRGYMDPAHEEKSVYNALPFRNLTVRGSGSGESGSIHVHGHLEYPRGLRTLLTLHAGPFGTDAQYGSVSSSAYNTVPSYHKVNRNRRYRFEASGDSDPYAAHALILTGSQYDNWWVQHPIPRAARGYRWIAESLPSGSDYFTYTILSGSFVTSLPVISSSDFASTGSGQLGDQPLAGPRVFGADSGTSTRDALGTPFNGMNTNVREPVTCRYNFLGFFEGYKDGGTDTTDLKNLIHYINIGNEGTEAPAVLPAAGILGGLVGSYSTGGVPAFNALMLHRNGPWGHPTWKQIRGSEHPVVRSQRYTNIISQRDYESQFIYYGDGWQTTVHGIKSNTVTRYIEQPLSSRHKPISFVMEDTSNQVTALMRLSWANNLDYFSNEKLNNRLDIAKDATLNTPYRLATAEVLNSNAPTIEYTERIYPRETSVYQNRFRSRTKYTEQMGLASKHTGRPQIWNSSRSIRSVSSSALASPKGFENTTVTVNSQGNAILNASCWPLDGPANDSGRAATTGSTPSNAGTNYGLATNDLSGELFNNYCRFGGYLSGTIKPAAHYAPLVPIGSASAQGSSVYYGGAKFEVASQTGQEPYRSYEEHMQYIRLIGKDHSIVPEFRISEHIGTLVEDNGSNWLADLDGSSPGMFDITGAAINNSYDLGSKICDVADTDDFYKVYGADFWKYFKVIDSDLNGKVVSNGRPLKKKLILECSALVKPLFYKGFYPVERTLELATLFSRSYGEHVSSSTPAAYRALLEPLFAPGILYNTIKSGIAVGNYVVVNPDWTTAEGDDITGSHMGFGQALSSSLTTLQGEYDGTTAAIVDFGPGSILSASTPRPVNKYGLQRIPFEAILHPQNYLNTGITVGSRRLSEGYISGSHIFDSGLGSASLSATDSEHPGSHSHRCSWDGSGKELYGMAIDNFLCETVNFFLKKGEKERPFGLTTLRGVKEESEWEPVEEDKAYAMTVHMRRPVNPRTGDPDLATFSMFNRGSGFGYPVALNQDPTATSASVSASFAHVTPGYFNGGCSVTMGFVADWTGKYNFDDIQTSLSFDYTRDLENKTEGTPGEDQYTTESPGYWFAQQIDQSIDFFDKATTDDGVYYMLQSKFETPVLNFAPGPGRSLNLATPTANSFADPGASDLISTVGMWCQSGSVPTDTSKGITISITNPESVTIDGVKYRGDNCKSLAELVGLDDTIGKPVPVGVIAHKQVLEEAVIAVPFTVDKNRRKFFDASGDAGALARMAQNMQKYVFPPKFETELPLFFAFEFDYDLDRDDLTKLYQNVMFDSDFKEVEGACEKKSSQVCSCCIEDEKLINQIYGCIDELKWLVFKVKRRAKRNYDLLRREGIDSQAILAKKHLKRPRTPTYNWPYDYFSLVELIKIDATARYSTIDAETLFSQQGPQETSTEKLFRGAVAQRIIGEETPEPTVLEGTVIDPQPGDPKMVFDTTIPTFGTNLRPRASAVDFGTRENVIDVDRVFSQPGKKGGYES